MDSTRPHHVVIVGAGFGGLATALGLSGAVRLPPPFGRLFATPRRRATSDTRASGRKVSATICAFSSADQRRRRPGPVSKAGSLSLRLVRSK